MMDDAGSSRVSLIIPSSPDRMDASTVQKVWQTPPQRTTHDILQDKAGEPNVSLDPTNAKAKFESIVAHVNRTLEELGVVYSEIGYSNREITQRQADVFLAIDDTIKSISSNAIREKNSVQNECEWLRQQIRFMLATLDDRNGEKTLKLSSRGIVFEDEDMYATGYREDVKGQVHSYRYSHQASFQASPFEEDLLDDEFSLQQQYEYMTRNIPQLTLLQTKSSLNNIFLEVLKAFVKVFRKYSDLSCSYWENLELIGMDSSTNTTLSSQLPSRNDAHEYLYLTEDFEATVKQLRLNEKMPKPNLANPDHDDDNAFVISSPKKARVRDQTKSKESMADLSVISQSSPDEAMSHLRELNGRLISALRGLKVMKLNSQFLSQLSAEVERSKVDVASRGEQMKEYVNQCLDIVVILSLSDADLIKFQQRVIHSKGEELANEGPFDSEALKLIESDILAFGLEASKLQYLERLSQMLKQLKESKQKKWDYYMKACSRLWEKLCEPPHYTMKFKEDNSTLSEQSILNLKMELNRLHIKRSEFIGSFIVDAQREIAQYQSLLYYSETQKQTFSHYDYNAEEDSDDKEQILNIHEAEVSRLKEEYDSKNYILDLYKELNEYLDDQKFLEESSKDSSRLLQKDSCKILMKEERIRKTINRNLPRVIKSLKEEVIKYNKESVSKDGKPFTVLGQDLYEKILSIESRSSNQGRSKFTRASPKRPSLSPKKTEPSAASNGVPKNSRLRSPIKIGKAVTQRRVSPALGLTRPNKLAAAQDRTSRSHFAAPSPVERQASMNSDTRYSLFDSPPKRPHGNLEPQERAQLPPLCSPLNPSAASLMNFSPSESTLYSICSRVSPLKDKNTNVKSVFRPIEGPGINMEDKENDNGNPAKSSDLVKESSHHRISSHSLANSTVISDVNEDWKEQRLREIQSRSDRLHDHSRLA